MEVGGPVFKFNEAISLQVFCETQEEIDYYWNKLSEGGDLRKYYPLSDEARPEYEAWRRAQSRS